MQIWHGITPLWNKAVSFGILPQRAVYHTLKGWFKIRLSNDIHNSPKVFRLGLYFDTVSLHHFIILVTRSSESSVWDGMIWIERALESLFLFVFFFRLFCFAFCSVLSGLWYSIAVRSTTSAKGTNWQRINQMSIILMSDVGGKLSILLMKMVVITSIVVKFTLRAASKKNGLKKVVAKVIAMRRREGK